MGQSAVYRADDPNIVITGTAAMIFNLNPATKYLFEIRAVSDLLGGLESQVKRMSVSTKKQ